MQPTQQPIVVGVDESPGSADAVRWAAELAAERCLPVHLVHAVWATDVEFGGGRAGTETLFSAASGAGEQVLKDAGSLVRAVGDKVAVTADMPTGSPAPLLIELSKTARMLVLGPTGAGAFAGMLLGSTAYSVASRARCPVAVIRRPAVGQTVHRSGPVVVGIDGSPTSEQAIAVAYQEAADRHVPLVAVHAWTDLTDDHMYELAGFAVPWAAIDKVEHRVLAERLAGWREKYPDVRVRRVGIRDSPRDALLDYSTEAQLVVVGSHGRGGFRRMLLGSTSHALIQHAECPVLVVRS